MLFSLLRPFSSRRRVPPQLLLSVAPLVALSAPTQAAPAMNAAPAVSTPAISTGVEAAQLTGPLAPTSAIAVSKSPVPALRRSDARSLLLSMPDAAPVKVAPLPKTALAASPSRPRLESSTPGNNAVKSALSRPAAVAKTEAGAPQLTAVAALAPALRDNPPRDNSPRSNAARLPARGGLILKPAPVELRPDQAPAVSDSQRLLLARLDADLARAQRRLDRAQSRLSEGQKQLGSATGLLRSAMLEAGDEGRGLNPFVRVAQRYLGTPYVWGGESARGFDCSGFIMRVMRDLGYQALPHSAAEQFRYGMPVAKELLKAGDIVFFANTYKPGVSHVGIYLGRGRFIHAANSQDGTIVSSLNQPKWVEKYAGARRLVPLVSRTR